MRPGRVGVFGLAGWLAALALFGCGSSSAGAPGTGGIESASAGSGAGTAGVSAGAASGGASGSSAGGSNAGTGGLTLGDSKTEACIAYALAVCGRQNECRGAQGGSSCLFASLSCPDLVFSPGATRTVAGVQACAEAYQKLPCDQLELGVLPECVTPGTVAFGAPCSFASQCASLSCGGDPSCGACVDASPQEGESCANGEQCSGQLDCKDGTCAKAPTGIALGEACSDAAGLYCQSGLVCDAVTSKCAEYPTLGMSCAATRSCRGGDSYCDIDALICKAFPAEGMPCGVDNLNVGAVYCVDPLLCARTSKTVGICKAPPQVAQPCLLDPETSQPESVACAAAARCDATKSPPTCATKVGQGQPCTRNLDCVAGTTCVCPAGPSCDASARICGRLQLKGQPCTAPGDVCHPGFSCTAGACEPRDSQGLFTAECGP